MIIGGMAKRNGIFLHGEKVTVEATVTNEGKMKVETKKPDLKKQSSLLKVPFLRGIVRYLELIFSMIKSNLKVLTIITAIVLGFVFIGTKFGFVNVEQGTETKLSVATFLMNKILIFVMLIVIMKKTKIAKFHAAEHMVIEAIRDGEELTIENIKKKNRIQRECGSIWYILLSMIGFWLFLLGVNSILAVIIAASLSYEMFIAEDDSKLEKFNSPFIRIAYFLQEHILTSEPDEEQLKCAAEAGKTIMKYELGELKI